jgi:hypothetical protein
MDNGKLKDFVGRLVRTFPEDFWGAVLFGSRARGDAGSSSDYDLFLVIDHLPLRPIERQRFLITRTGSTRGISIIAKSRQEFEAAFPSLYLDLALDGNMLYDKEGYMTAHLARIRELTTAAGLVRERRPHGFTWKWKRPPRARWRVDWTGVYGIV